MSLTLLFKISYMFKQFILSFKNLYLNLQIYFLRFLNRNLTYFITFHVHFLLFLFLYRDHFVIKKVKFLTIQLIIVKILQFNYCFIQHFPY
jgi:hypothetical protein